MKDLRFSVSGNAGKANNSLSGNPGLHDPRAGGHAAGEGELVHVPVGGQQLPGLALAL